MKVAVIGGGWAGMAAAVTAAQRGHEVTVLEAARVCGGRARPVDGQLPDGRSVTLDNGQHILIGAYSETLRLMRSVGVDPDRALLRLPLALVFPDGSGLALPRAPAPLDALAGILAARGWSWRDKASLLKTALTWRASGFRCDARQSVAELCESLSPRLRDQFIEPLCVSALNTPADRASGAVFLRVLRDALFSGSGGSNLLLPRVSLGALFPEAAARWLTSQGHRVRLAHRVTQLRAVAGRGQNPCWQLAGEAFDRVIVATPWSEAVRLVRELVPPAAPEPAASLSRWIAQAATLQPEVITTVYAMAARDLPRPMLSLRSDGANPAQFVFDRGQLGGPQGLLAFVISASSGERDELAQAVTRQAQAQLGLTVTPFQTIIEKRATFACTPGLVRPAMALAPGLVACGDYVEGPYPATLEGAVRSGRDAANLP